MDYKHFSVKLTATESGNYHLNAQFHPFWNNKKIITLDQDFLNWKEIIAGARSLYETVSNLFSWAKELYNSFYTKDLSKKTDAWNKVKEKSQPTDKNFSTKETEATPLKDLNRSPNKAPKERFQEPDSKQKISATSETAKNMIPEAKKKAQSKKQLKSPSSKEDFVKTALCSPLTRHILKTCMELGQSILKENNSVVKTEGQKNRFEKKDSSLKTDKEKEKWSIWIGFSMSDTKQGSTPKRSKTLSF
ncbi:hypothetical protein [Methylacidiphilum kamchatkense]|nr:hypothetical protein [Methylacidiphilum kamchatkense]QDQ43137.1 hypothetical protein kam1_1926 [Methylacidiphilum kamchatkense Kam1]